MHSSTILYLLAALLCCAYAVLLCVAQRSRWLRQIFGAERMVEEVMETDFFDNTGDFARSPSPVSGVATVPSAAYPSAPSHFGEGA